MTALRDIVTVCTLCLSRTPWYNDIQRVARETQYGDKGPVGSHITGGHVIASPHTQVVTQMVAGEARVPCPVSHSGKGSVAVMYNYW